MYAQLGNIIFENLKGFTEYYRTGDASYAEHKMLTGKPLLQPTGLELDEIDLSIRLHASFCNPFNELSQLKTYRDQFSVLTLINGNGKVEGDFVITSINETVEDADNQGNIFSYVVSLVLKEYVTINKLQAEQQQDKQQATAVGDKKPVAKKKINASTCPQTVTGIVTNQDNHSKAINLIITEKGGIVSPVNRASVLQHLNAIRALNNDLISRCNDPESCANTIPALLTAANQVQASVDSFSVATNNGNNNQAIGENQTLSASIKALKASANTLIQQSITGNG